MKRIQDAIIKVLGSVGAVKVTGFPRFAVIVLLALILGCVCLYIAGWLYLANQGKIDLAAMDTLLKTLTAASFIAAWGFIVKGLIDSDGDGIPNAFDDEDDRKRDEK